MLGERPINQLLPAARWMREQLGVGRWAVIGNDYVFPRVTGATARLALQGGPSSVVSETYVPLGTTNFSGVLTNLEGGQADGVIMLLMGQDAVHFNRQFARQGLRHTGHVAARGEPGTNLRRVIDPPDVVRRPVSCLYRLGQDATLFRAEKAKSDIHLAPIIGPTPA